MTSKTQAQVDLRFSDADFYAVVPGRALNDRRISRSDLQVFAALISFLRPGHTKVWPKRATISRRCNGIDKTNISRATTRLEAAGYITKEATVDGIGAIYHFVNMSEARGAFERWKSFVPDVDQVNNNPEWFINNQPDIGPAGAGVKTTQKYVKRTEVSDDEAIPWMGEGVSTPTPHIQEEHATKFENPEKANAFSCPELIAPDRKPSAESLFCRPEIRVVDSRPKGQESPGPDEASAVANNPVDRVEPQQEAVTPPDWPGVDDKEAAYRAVAAFFGSDGVKVLPAQKKRHQRPNSAGSAEDNVPAIVEIPTIGRVPGPFKVTQALIDRYKDLFPGIDPVLEAKRAAAWCEDSPSRRKTMRGCQAFLTKWMGRAYDNSRGYRSWLYAPRNLHPDGPDPSGNGYWLKGKRYPDENTARAAYGDISHFKHNPDAPEDALKHAMRKVYGEESGW